MRRYIDRFSRWYNDLKQNSQWYYLLLFCLLFLALLWLSVRFLRLDTCSLHYQAPHFIGRSSGPAYHDTLNAKKQ